jgi:predicted glycosyltransferase
MKKKLLFIAQDGSGLGHLSRLCKIAEQLQDKYSILILTGKPQIYWKVPSGCEYIRIPSWSSLRKKQAKLWGKNPWIDIDDSEAVEFISKLYCSICEIFKPDGIIIDYLPFGKYGELVSVLKNCPAKKILIHRGIVDSSDLAVFSKSESSIYGGIYDRILVACDKRVVDFYTNYNQSEVILPKLETIGYIRKHVDTLKTRKEELIPDGYKWIVCSAGGGKNAEEFLKSCLLAAEKFPKVYFSIICGPFSNVYNEIAFIKPENCTVHFEKYNLHELLGACDISVITGGYNSITESMYNRAQIIVFPSQSEGNDEQIIQAERLAKYYPIFTISNISQLESSIEICLGRLNQLWNHPFELDMDGLNRIEGILENELNTKLLNEF